MKNTFINKIVNGLLWNQMRHYTIFILSFLLSIVLARGLGPSDYGTYAGILALIGVFVLISSLGLEAVSLIYLPRISHEEKPQKTSYFIKRLLITRIVISFLISIVIILLPQKLFNLIGITDINFTNISFMLFAYFILSNANLLMGAFYKGLMRFKPLYIIDTITYSINLALCFLILLFTKNLTIIFAVLILSQIVAIFIYAFGMKSILSRKSEKFEFDKVASLSANLYGTRFIQFTLGRQKDILLIGYFLQNPMLLGFYNLGARLSDVVDGLFTKGFGEVTQPSFSEKFTKHGIDGLKSIWQDFMRLEILLTIPFLVFAIFYAKTIIIFFYSDNFIPVTPVFQLFCIMLLISGGILGGGTSQKIFYAIKKERLAFKIILSAGILNITLGLIFIPIYGILGAVFASGMSVVYWRLIELLFVIRLINTRFPFQFLFKIASAVVVSFIISSTLKVHSMPTLLFSGILYFLLFVLMIYLLKPFNHKDKAKIQRVYPNLVKYAKHFCKD